MKIILALLAAITLSASAFAQVPTATPDDVCRNAYAFRGRSIALVGIRFDERQTSPTEYTVWLGADINVTVTTAQMAAMRASIGRKLYVWIGDVRDGKPVVTVLGNSMAFDINRRPRFSWAQNADK